MLLTALVFASNPEVHARDDAPEEFKEAVGSIVTASRVPGPDKCPSPNDYKSLRKPIVRREFNREVRHAKFGKKILGLFSAP